MSTRVKFLAFFGLLFSLMTLMLNYGATTSEVSKGNEAKFTGILLVLLALVGLIIIIEVFLSWRDIPQKRKNLYRFNEALYYILWALSAVGVVFISYGIKNMRIQPLPINASNNTSSVGTVTAPTPVYHNSTLTPGNEMFPTTFALYLALLAALAGFLYFTLVYYREALKKRKRKEMKLRAELFDKKLDELGLDMFSDPREAVVGIYKNAVLWLEVLGIPYRESWTHWEHAERVRYMHDAFVDLTRLFEKAKYAPEKVTWDDAKRALDVYRKMRGGLSEAQ
ncbi:DUF4129 domain-containing protein [Thermococcus piezophilus]|uniref:Protein-glutamine gamma-glutamyltransferase-like C-terminal domain-containing protein n=1 Tax=Thermococcus piezophilus TaxID=1712654 RepID=A0A172WG16_9EURY|nr:DUF4129 domain-containing protein [Thermococcus piezophilus]ANF22377.1 hypothetical protein A7C91_03710 [Thermococcus piezophilus]